MNEGIIKALAKMPHILYAQEARKGSDVQMRAVPAIPPERVAHLAQGFIDVGGALLSEDEAYIIAAYHDAVEGINRGALSHIEARRLLRDTLQPAGFLLDHVARQQFILENVTAMAAGYAQHEQMKNSAAYPAQKLVRMGFRNSPRNWPARWRQAYAALPLKEQRKAHPTEMVATTECAIWRGISRWGEPYPPFDFNSGMDVMPVDFDTANAMGILGGSTKDENTLYGVRRELPPGMVMPEIEVEITGLIDDAPITTQPPIQKKAASSPPRVAAKSGKRPTIKRKAVTRPKSSKVTSLPFPAHTPPRTSRCRKTQEETLLGKIISGVLLVIIIIAAIIKMFDK